MLEDGTDSRTERLGWRLGHPNRDELSVGKTMTNHIGLGITEGTKTIWRVFEDSNPEIKLGTVDGTRLNNGNLDRTTDGAKLLLGNLDGKNKLGTELTAAKNVFK
jgi:hypothetical protein